MIAAFIANRVSAYIAAGISPGSAAQFTRNELKAIYLGNHYSRDASGAMHITPLPEALDTEVAMVKADEALTEFMKAGAGSRAGLAPEKHSEQELRGFEKMAEYARSMS